jgi:hypothetical protein
MRTGSGVARQPRSERKPRAASTPPAGWSVAWAAGGREAGAWDGSARLAPASEQPASSTSAATT